MSARAYIEVGYITMHMKYCDSTLALVTIEIWRDIAHTSCIVYFVQSTDDAGKMAQ